jgi:hypothetical protein
MKTTLIFFMALFTLAALLLPVKLANSEVYQDFSGISISYKIGAQQNNSDNKDADETFLNEINESSLDSFDNKLNLEDWMTDLTEWETVK